MATAIGSVIALQVVIVAWIVFRSVRLYYGRRLSVPRLFLFPALTLLIFLSTEVQTVASIPSAYPGWAAVDGAVLLLAAIVTVPLAPRFVTVTKAPRGGYLYRYGIELISLYLVLWIARFALAAVYDPTSLGFAFSPGGAALSGTAATVLLTVQTLFAASSGIVVGRSIGTYRVYRAHTDENGPLPSG